MRFIAIDVETANADLASICQIGVVTFQDGLLAKSWGRLVNPEVEFDSRNVAIHGITHEMVQREPAFPILFSELQECLTGEVVVSHTAFDRLSLARAAEKHDLPALNCTWLDSAKVVRRAWPAHAQCGYGLKDISKVLGIVFRHHDAVEDARAAGEVVLRAIAETDKTLEDWLVRVRQPIWPIAREGNHEGPLAGEVVVFTGALSITRREAAELAANAGCTVVESVNKATTLLVVGNQDIHRLAGHEKSSKHRKAEALREKGQAIRVLAECDFRRLLEVECAG